jgi:hypothetical protein
MAIVRSKGTVLKMTIATVLTAVGQMLSLEFSEAENETFEADYLDNADAGIPYRSTGRTEGGELSYEGWFDPALAGHQAITDLLTNPEAGGTECQVVYADAAETEWDFTAAGASLGVAVALNEGLKCKGKFKLDGLVTYPT